MVKWSFSGSLYFEITPKKFKLNLVLVVALVLESKGLYFVVWKHDNKCEKKGWENLGLPRDSNPDLCDTGAAL